MRVAGAPAASPAISSTCKEQVPPWHFPLREDAVCYVARVLSEGRALAPVGLLDRGSLALERDYQVFVLEILTV